MSDHKEFARQYPKKLGERTLRAIGKVLEKHDAGVIEFSIEMADEVEMLNERLKAIKDIIDAVESRCMAADGPVTNTRHEMSDKELQRIYRLAGGAAL